MKKRSSMPYKKWRGKSLAITQKVISHPLYLRAGIIYCYVDYRNEAGTKKIIESCIMDGKSVAVPRIEDGKMLFYRINGLSCLKKGRYGIPEPQTGQVMGIKDDETGLVIMPGVAFDVQRNRIGYGKGFYDRFLSLHPQLHTMAIAFSCQIVSAIPYAPHDIRPGVLVTEDYVYE